MAIIGCESQFSFLLGEYGPCSPAGCPTVPLGEISGTSCIQLNINGGTFHRVEFDLGADYLTDFDAADGVAIFGMRELLEAGGATTIQVRAADDPLFTVNAVAENFNPTINDLVGLRNEDFYAELTAFVGNERRYWRVTWQTTNSISPKISEVMLGKRVIVSRSPLYPARMRLVEEFVEAPRRTWQLDLRWRGLAEEEKIELEERLFYFYDVQRLVLVDAANALFFNKLIMRVMVRRDPEFTLINNGVYRLDAEFLEIL